MLTSRVREDLNDNLILVPVQYVSTTMTLTVKSPADFHVHLRQGTFSELITPHVRKGGFDLAYVMVSFATGTSPSILKRESIQPNLKPPITTTEQALNYKADLERIDPNVEYLMTLDLSPELTPEEIRKASAAGIVGTGYLGAINFSNPFNAFERCQIISPGRNDQL